MYFLSVVNFLLCIYFAAHQRDIKSANCCVTLYVHFHLQSLNWGWYELSSGYAKCTILKIFHMCHVGLRLPSWEVDSFFELSNNIAIFYEHGRVIYLGMVVNKDIGFALAPTTVRPLCDIPSFGEFASGVLLKAHIIFHMSCLLLFVLASSSTPFQPSVLVSLITVLASLQASISSWQLTLIVQQSWLHTQIFALTWGVIQSFAFCCGLILPMWTSATAFGISLKWAKHFGRLFLVARSVIWSLTTLPKFS